MGWDSCAAWTTPKDIHDDMRRRYDGSKGWKLIDSAATSYGRHFWTIIETPEGERFLGLTLIQGNGSWLAKKDISESMGPCELDCPLRLLDALPVPDSQWAREWRDKVRAYHAKRSVEWKAGDAVLMYGKRYTVVRKQKRSWIVEREDGQVFRASATNMNRPK